MSQRQSFCRLSALALCRTACCFAVLERHRPGRGHGHRVHRCSSSSSESGTVRISAGSRSTANRLEAVPEVREDTGLQSLCEVGRARRERRGRAIRQAQRHLSGGKTS
jgi:hypothetical protein